MTQNRKEKRKKTGYVAAKNRKFFGKKWKSDGNKMGNDDQEYAKIGSRPGEKRDKLQDKTSRIAKKNACVRREKGQRRRDASALP